MLSEGRGWPVAPPRAEQHSGSTLRSCLPPPAPLEEGCIPAPFTSGSSESLV